MRDFSQELVHVKRLCALGRINTLAQPFVAGMAHGLDRGLLRGALTMVANGNDNTRALEYLSARWALLFEGGHPRDASTVVRALWDAAPHKLGELTAYGGSYEYRDVLGVPVGGQPNYARGYAHLPCSDASLLERARGRAWVFTLDEESQLVMLPDSPVSKDAVLDPKTAEIIESVECIPGCRCHVLQGPPRSGKSTAAKQIAAAVDGAWVRVAGDASRARGLWSAINTLQPQAIIIDDLDADSGADTPLMQGLENARGYARVIVSTVNTLETLRGAVLGRAASGEPTVYAELSPAVRARLAPGVAESLGASDLLAQHQLELQARSQSPHGVSREDVEELRRLQELIGES